MRSVVKAFWDDRAFISHNRVYVTWRFSSSLVGMCCDFADGVSLCCEALLGIIFVGECEWLFSFGSECGRSVILFRTELFG